jgi:hypothetical protein
MILQRCAYAAGALDGAVDSPANWKRGPTHASARLERATMRPLGRISCVMLDMPVRDLERALAARRSPPPSSRNVHPCPT